MSDHVFDRDLQGRRWQPCPACPRRADRGGDGSEGACPSRSHPAWCKHVTADPDRWADHVRSLPPETRPPREVPGVRHADLVVRGHINAYTGYGQITIDLADQLRRRGLDPVFEAIAGGPTDTFVPLPDWVWFRSVERGAGPVLQIANPHLPPLADRRTVTLTMWESSRLRESDVAALNAAELVLVPCRWNAECFIAQGVTTPIRIQPLGIDTAVFRPDNVHRRDSGGLLVFGCAGRLQHGGVRKGLQDVVTGFRAAFPRARTDVRLRVKLWPDDPALDAGDDPRIELCRDPLPIAGLADWYRGLDVFVSCSRAEGFGLQPLQALACGVPVLAGWHSGHAEYLDAGCAWDLPCRPEPAEGLYAGMGDWYVPDPDALVEQLRAIAAAPDQVEAKGQHATRVGATWTWDRAGAVLHATLTGQFGLRRNPMESDEIRRNPTLGVCGMLDRLDTLPEAIPLLRPHVDAFFFVVDDRAPSSVGAWLTAQAIPWRPFRWSNSYSAPVNAAADAVGTDWVLQFDADEVLVGADRLRDAVAMAEARGLDVIHLKRKHWYDLARTTWKPEWWPDWQSRLRRRHIRLRWRAHPEVVAESHRQYHWQGDDLYLEHFNLALRTDADWKRINLDYDLRIAEDRAAGRHWNDPDPGSTPREEPSPTPASPAVCPHHGSDVPSRCGCWFHCNHLRTAVTAASCDVCEVSP